MSDMMQLFRTVILVQLFYAFAITGLVYVLDVADTDVGGDAVSYATGFSDIADELSLTSVSEDVQGSIQQQTNIPVVELGALVFYSGNILIDLLLNFAFAIPQMMTMLVQGLLMLFNFDTYIWVLVQLFLSVVVIVLYFIGLMQLLIGVRSGRLV